jgi:hypothetical protein
MRTPLITALTFLVIFDGLGWPAGVLPTLYYAFTRRELPRLAGIRLLSGPFEALGLDAFMVAGLIFVVISGLKLLAAYWLWHARRDGAVLELILLALSAIFWYGFALPFGLTLRYAGVVWWSSLAPYYSERRLSGYRSIQRSPRCSRRGLA